MYDENFTPNSAYSPEEKAWLIDNYIELTEEGYALPVSIFEWQRDYFQLAPFCFGCKCESEYNPDCEKYAITWDIDRTHPLCDQCAEKENAEIHALTDFNEEE